MLVNNELRKILNILILNINIIKCIYCIGFTSNLEAYLPIDPTYWKLNVERQKAEHNSFYTMFKNLTRLRQTNTCKYGELKTQIVSKWMYIISRYVKHTLHITNKKI